MLASIVRAMLKQRLLVVVVALGLCAAGVFAAKNLPVDAFPDVTNIQVQVATVAIGPYSGGDRATDYGTDEDRHDRVTGTCGDALPEQESFIAHHPGFTDQTDVFFARQLVMERLIEVSPR